MGRRPRRNQHERCQPPDAKKSGMATAWLVVFLLTFWQGAGPSLCPAEKPMVADAGCEPVVLPPVPETVWADSGHAEGTPQGPWPAPTKGQKTPKCPNGAEDLGGYCWRKQPHPLPCAYDEVLWGGACWTPVPAPESGPPISGGG